MDSKRLIIFIALSFSILLLWQEYFAPKPVAKPAVTQQASTAASSSDTPAANASSVGQRITVTTDLVKAEIDTTGGDLRSLQLLKHNAAEDASKPFELFTDKGAHLYVAQTGLIAAGNAALPTHKTVFSAEKTAYTLQGDKVEIKLTAPEANGVKVSKVYTFHKGSYLIDVRYDIVNAGTTPLASTAYYRLLRDGKAPEGESRFAQTFTGPAVYTTEGTFQKVAFSDLDKGKAEYVKSADNGWVAMLQHYFMSAWILKPLDGKSVCANAQACQFQLEPKNGAYSAAAMVNVAPIAAGQSASITVPLYAGPEEYNTITKVADGMEFAKDFGMVHIFASPLFWLLTKLHSMVQNWGWAIILLTLIVKAVFYPLTAASYRSMAKMKVLAPRLENLKQQFGDDRMKFQQAVMEMYKTDSGVHRPVLGAAGIGRAASGPVAVHRRPGPSGPVLHPAGADGDHHVRADLPQPAAGRSDAGEDDEDHAGSVLGDVLLLPGRPGSVLGSQQPAVDHTAVVCEPEHRKSPQTGTAIVSSRQAGVKSKPGRHGRAFCLVEGLQPSAHRLPRHLRLAANVGRKQPTRRTPR